ncbi:hypothetical protein NP603_01955 [Methylomonas sp. SURF-1]|uniref:Uncharacterized protein n=1 Tax=Methylomonas aurea TaxID=2952224 RepID=A0ABT1UCY7_9GAMM|nr:hypothetical protein [Methylomonas sp. SURF-1]MCQ8179861.1 hypothetical protein [Methylomonas sp. SURF-1]
MKVSNNEKVPSLINIASDLYFLKHREAGDSVSSILSNINSSTDSAQRGQIDNAEFGKRHALWQKEARELTPSKKVLWAFWGNI